jgi:uncharacterized protein involved in oxidation of intracellular sulfur
VRCGQANHAQRLLQHRTDDEFSINKGAKVKICGFCAVARGLKNAVHIKGTEISNMAELSQWVVDSDMVITF